jgi:hypothetical protein
VYFESYKFCSQLIKDGFSGAAAAVSEITLIPPPSNQQIQREEDEGRLWKLLQMGLQREQEENPNQFGTLLMR